jgi:hypothetical protein
MATTLVWRIACTSAHSCANAKQTVGISQLFLPGPYLARQFSRARRRISSRSDVEDCCSRNLRQVSRARARCSSGGTFAGARVLWFPPVGMGLLRININPERPYGSSWRRIPAHLGIPVRPGTWVDDPWRCMIKRFSKIVIRHVLTDDPHVLRKRVGHGVRHKSHRISQSLFGRFEPDDISRDVQSLRCNRDRFHRLKPMI